ncbi:hypothetical protein Tco_0435911 [Tanacetum coccineum]
MILGPQIQRGELNTALALQNGLMVMNEAMVLPFGQALGISANDEELIYGGMFVARLARSFGILTQLCHWVRTCGVQQQQEQEKEDEEANEDSVGSSEDAYRGMSQKDWHAYRKAWMDWQNGRWGQLDT